MMDDATMGIFGSRIRGAKIHAENARQRAKQVSLAAQVLYRRSVYELQ